MRHYRNSIEHGVRPVVITADFREAAGEAAYKELKAMLAGIEGGIDPVLHGTALRDLFIGLIKPAFYDIEATNRSARASDIVKQDLVTECGTGIEFIKIPQSFDRDEVWERALRADAPINAVAMGLDGHVMAHPDFMRHAQRGIYLIRGDLEKEARGAALDRYHRIRRRYPGLNQNC